VQMAPVLLVRFENNRGSAGPERSAEAVWDPRDPARLAPCALRSEIRTPSPRFRTGKGWAS